MPELDPAMAAILAEIRRQNLPTLDTMPAAAARAEAERRNAYWNENPVPIGQVEEVVAPGPLGDIRLRLYAGERAVSRAPCLVYIHGGGWVICSLDTHDVVCRHLAAPGEFMVASVDYRMAPEHPFPAPLEDCLAALRWLRAQATSLGIDPERIAVAGDSAGANLALAACLRLRDLGEKLPRAAGLIYGAYTDDHDSPSHAAFGNGDYVLSTAMMRWFWDHYVPDPAQRRDPLACPLYADLRGLPPLYVSAAEFDPLRDDSERLARRLIDAGADVDYRLWRGVTHACIMMSRALPAADRYLADIREFTRRNLV